MDKVTVKPTWQLAWGMWWRLFFINLGIMAIIFGILFAVGITLMPSWEEWWMTMIPW